MPTTRGGAKRAADSPPEKAAATPSTKSPAAKVPAKTPAKTPAKCAF